MINFRGEERDILLYSFRYSLPRMSYCTLTVSQIIINNWSELSKHDRQLYQREIKEAIDSKNIGMDCDKRNWERILQLRINDD